MGVLQGLEPQAVFHFFEELSRIPRETFHTKEVSDYCVKFAKERNLEYIQDEWNDVIIKKPGTPGYENSEPIILQGHLDMVCVKVDGSEHDFRKDPIDLMVEDGFVKANGTSLGGDDGIAIAFAMAILDSHDIPHPPIEAVFTVDEETSMTGATHIDLSGLKGRKLLNIDSEEEGILTVGCAGGITNVVNIPLTRKEVTGTKLTFTISGLLGGHSGAEIHKQRGNAIKLMGRLLECVRTTGRFYLLDMTGGTKTNVIPGFTKASILVKDSSQKESILSEVSGLLEKLQYEFMEDEPGLSIQTEVEEGVTADAVKKGISDRIKELLLLAPNGVMSYSRTLPGFVEASLNLGVVSTSADTFSAAFMIRSNVDSLKDYLNRQVTALAVLSEGSSEISNDYPAWQFLPNSELQQLMVSTFEEMFGKKPEVSAVHAGLECGLFLGKRPDLDCVSVGPDLFDVHSVNERLSIASTERTWKYLLRILEQSK